MHWSDKIAEEIIRRAPDKEEYVCAAGISPSGSIHIGNFRDIATSLFVCKALEKKGKRARLLFSWDEYDRMRKVPVNVAQRQEGFEKYIGCPYVDVPNPFDTDAASYAEYFEREFEDAVARFGIQMDYRHQAQMYRGGAYREQILLALRRRGEIFDILDSFRTQDAKPGEREAYYPVSVYCPECGRDTTVISSYDEESHTARYSCKCGFSGEFSFDKDTHCKLSWKVDWPMRWMVEGVDFEPGGKDHATPGGSYDTAKVIAKEIFGIEAPLFTGYEFIGIKGTTGKMSGSSGLNLTPETLLKLYQPEVILWLYAKVEPQKAFNFCFDDGILRQYYEFDKQYTAYKEQKADEHTRDIMSLCLIEGREISTVPMSLLVSLGSVVDFNVPMLETVFEKVGQPFKYEDFSERLGLARYWLENCAPEQANHLLKRRNFEVWESLSEPEREEIRLLHDYLSTQNDTLDALQAEIYAIPKKLYGENPENLRALQTVFFRNVYRLLLGKDTGPRLYLFLYAIDRDSYLRLLDFSAPMTDEERETSEQPEPEKAETQAEGVPDEVAPFKSEISFDDFQKLDLRVCSVRKCAEIRKSQNCYKLTVFDGVAERVIVSGLRDSYTPEQLIGKKVVVLVNIEPRRITGVTSQGMLLAAQNGACGCKVLFADDAVPEGTALR